MLGAKYSLIHPNEFDIQDDRGDRSCSRSSLSRQWKGIVVALIASVILSLSMNAVLIHRQFYRSCERHDSGNVPSKFAHLQQNVPTDMVQYNDFESPNRTIQNEAWGHPDMIPENGFIALDEEYALSMDLPHSQRWPWDSSKGVYILTSAHQMHCIFVMRQSVNDYRDGTPESEQQWSYEHVLHCLNVLREAITCAADDTPMYTGHLHGNKHHSLAKAGRGQNKMCRDWHALQEWSRDHSACYRMVHYGEKDFPELERYKYCPDGSRPWEES